MSRSNPYYNGPQSDHFDGLRFFNPDAPDTDRGLGDVLRWQRASLGKAKSVWPAQVPVTQVVPEASVTGLRATLVGHATVLVQMQGLNLLTDPVWAERASPLSFAGPKRVNAPGIDLAQLPPIHAVLLSHNHYDHLDLHALKHLHAVHAMPIFTPLGNDALLRKHIPGVDVRAGDWGDRFECGGAEITVVPAQHWSSRGVRDRRMALWGGFMVRNGAGLVYFAGDTGYGDGRIFKALRRDHGQPDLALIPIGAYEPRWFMAAQHVNPAEAVSIMLDLGARQALGIHWGTFKLTDEGWEAPRLALTAALAAHGLPRDRFVAGLPGDRLDVPRAAGA